MLLLFKNLTERIWGENYLLINLNNYFYLKEINAVECKVINIWFYSSAIQKKSWIIIFIRDKTAITKPIKCLKFYNGILLRILDEFVLKFLRHRVLVTRHKSVYICLQSQGYWFPPVNRTDVSRRLCILAIDNPKDVFLKWKESATVAS